MNIDSYFTEIGKLAEIIFKKRISTHTYLESLIDSKAPIIEELIEFREEFIDSKDQEKVTPYLVTGFLG